MWLFRFSQQNQWRIYPIIWLLFQLTVLMTCRVYDCCFSKRPWRHCGRWQRYGGRPQWSASSQTSDGHPGCVRGRGGHGRLRGLLDVSLTVAVFHHNSSLVNLSCLTCISLQSQLVPCTPFLSHQCQPSVTTRPLYTFSVSPVSAFSHNRPLYTFLLSPATVFHHYYTFLVPPVPAFRHYYTLPLHSFLLFLWTVFV